jgi:hypothetical protein
LFHAAVALSSQVGACAVAAILSLIDLGNMPVQDYTPSQTTQPLSRNQATKYRQLWLMALEDSKTRAPRTGFLHTRASVFIVRQHISHKRRRGFRCALFFGRSQISENGEDPQIVKNLQPTSQYERQS